MSSAALRAEYTIKLLKGRDPPNLGQGYDYYTDEYRLEPDRVLPKDLEELKLPEHVTTASWQYSTMSEYSTMNEGISATASARAKIFGAGVGLQAEASRNWSKSSSAERVVARCVKEVILICMRQSVILVHYLMVMYHLISHLQ